MEDLGRGRRRPLPAAVADPVCCLHALGRELSSTTSSGTRRISSFSQVLFAVVASVFVQVYAPHAFHTGIPEIKAILGGYIIVDFLSGSTLLIKSLGLPLAVASGLSLGKEGPLVHVACCIGNVMLRPFKVLRGNEGSSGSLNGANC